jgi:integrase/recombinase XerD
MVRGQGGARAGGRVAAYIEWLGKPDGQGLSRPSMKQHLAALRMLFDWLVVGHIIEHNPAHAVRGPNYRPGKNRQSPSECAGRW